MALVALIRPPTSALADGERTHVKREAIDFARAQEQHINYVVALRDAGAEIIAMPPMEHCPNAVFIEDTALVLDTMAVVAHSGARSRWVETAPVSAVLSNYCYLIRMPAGATFDGGDALVIDRTVYVGHMHRTNMAGVKFLMTLLRQNGYEVVPVPISECLHLKTAVSYIGNNTVLMNPNWVSPKEFAKHTQIMVDSTEPKAANALLAGNSLFVSGSYPATLHDLTARGFSARPLELSEFHKAEGGPTCLSILINTPRAH